VWVESTGIWSILVHRPRLDLLSESFFVFSPNRWAHVLIVQQDLLALLTALFVCLPEVTLDIQRVASGLSVWAPHPLLLFYFPWAMIYQRSLWGGCFPGIHLGSNRQVLCSETGQVYLSSPSPQLRDTSICKILTSPTLYLHPPNLENCLWFGLRAGTGETGKPGSGLFLFLFFHIYSSWPKSFKNFAFRHLKLRLLGKP
jgi:hypothetical protein